MEPSDSAPDREVVGVSEALGRAGDAMAVLGPLWVEGEVFEYKGPWKGSGHYYFKLRDDRAVMDVKIWAQSVGRALRCELEEGRKVRVRGAFDVYAARGTLSFILDRVEDQGEGDLARQFQQLKERLVVEGLFDVDRKQPLPALPRTVGVLTSHPSAAWEDVLNTFLDRQAPLRILVRGCRVQGQGAAEDMVQGLREMVSAKPDLVLLTRGGGSLKDLWAFNDEILVREVADCPFPILSAVGHETDNVLTDLAADAFSRTPTAGAVRICAGWEEARESMGLLANRLEEAATRVGDACSVRLARVARDLGAQSPSRRLERFSSRLLQGETRLVAVGLHRSARARSTLLRESRRLHACLFRQSLPLLREGLLGAQARLQGASPKALLERGWALVEADGQSGFLRDPGSVASGHGLNVTLSRGSLRARVE